MSQTQNKNGIMFLKDQTPTLLVDQHKVIWAKQTFCTFEF